MNSQDAMKKGDLEALQRLLRQREKVLKSAAKLRSADLRADFENQMGSEYSFDDDEVWADAMKAADAEVAKAQKRVADRCRERGIPERFAPQLRLSWAHRGYDNVLDKRRKELRHMANTQIEALEQRAIVQIEQASVEAQTELAVATVTSDAARAFVDRLPTVEDLMPKLSYQDVAGEADPPVVEQLVSPNALRQRRFRDRQKALHNGEVTPEPALGDATE